MGREGEPGESDPSRTHPRDTGKKASSAAVSAVSASVVSRFSNEASSTVFPAPLGPARLLVGAPEPAAGELVVDEHRNSGCPVSQRAFCPVGLGGRISWCLVVYVLFPINGAREKTAGSEAISAMGCKCG